MKKTSDALRMLVQAFLYPSRYRLWRQDTPTNSSVASVQSPIPEVGSGICCAVQRGQLHERSRVFSAMIYGQLTR